MNLLGLGSMSEVKSGNRRLRVMRVVTASYVVPWHLGNTLKRMPKDFETYVVGQGVSANRDAYPGVTWIDLDLDRKVSLWRDLWALVQLCRILLAVRPDIVHSIMPKAGLLSAMAGFLCRVPTRMHTFTGQVWATRKGLGRRFFYFIDRLILLLNTLCMTDSPSQSTYLYDNGFTHNGEHLPYLYYGSLSGVDLKRFHSDEVTREIIREKLKIPPDSIVFLFVGRLNMDKGVLDLACAFVTLCKFNAYLVLVGPDEENIIPRIMHIKSICSDKLRFTGYAQTPEDYMAASDIFCIPSYREGFGSVVIEAASVGLPAIGTRIPGLIDAIEDGKTGILIPAGDVNALAEAMRNMVENPKMLAALGEQARHRTAVLFSADVVYTALSKMYRELARNR